MLSGTSKMNREISATTSAVSNGGSKVLKRGASTDGPRLLEKAGRVAEKFLREQPRNT